MKSLSNKVLILTFWLPFAVFSQIKKPVEDLHLAKFRWMELRQLDSLAMLLHPQVQYIHSNGWIESKEEMLQNIRDEILVYRKVTIESSSMRKKGRIAVVIGQGLFEVTLRGNELSIPLRYEEHYIKTRQGWYLIYRKSERINN